MKKTQQAPEVHKRLHHLTRVLINLAKANRRWARQETSPQGKALCRGYTYAYLLAAKMLREELESEDKKCLNL